MQNRLSVLLHVCSAYCKASKEVLKEVFTYSSRHGADE